MTLTLFAVVGGYTMPDYHIIGNILCCYRLIIISLNSWQQAHVFVLHGGVWPDEWLPTGGFVTLRPGNL